VQPCFFRSLFANAGFDNLAHVTESSHIVGSFQTLFLVLVGQLGGVAATIQALHIQAPAVFFLNESGTVTLRTLLQADLFNLIHDAFSFAVLFLPAQYIMFAAKKQP
jgi:hypothetical protein